MIIGSSGYIGGYLASHFDRSWHLVAAGRSSGLDVRDGQQVRDTIRRVKPDVVLHLANYGTISACQRNPTAAQQVIVEGTRNVSAACSENGAYVMFFSTDYVFDGRRGGYSETDPANARSVFGKAKIAAETLLMKACPDRALVLRTAGVYGYRGGKPENFDLWALSRFAKGESFVAYDDIFNTPTAIDDLVAGVERCIAQRLPGLYHLAGGQRVSRYEFCVQLARAGGFSPALVVPGSAGHDEGDLRPRDVSLNAGALEEAIGMRFSGPEEGLTRCSY
jgi:dTDP-4-dehydrorhamnose reductase